MGARGARCRPARPGGQRDNLPRQGRPPSRLRPERSGSPCVAPADARGRQWVLDGVAHVQPVRPAPVDGGHAAADWQGVGHLTPQQHSGPAARPEDAPPHGRGPVPELGAGHVPVRSVRTGRGAPPSISARGGLGSGRSQDIRGRLGRGAHPPPQPDSIRQDQADPSVRRRVRGVPQRAHLVSRPPASHSRAPRLGRPTPVPTPIQDQGCPPQRARPLARAPGHPPCSSSLSRPAGTCSGSWGSPPPTSTGQRPCPAPPSRRPRHGTGCTPSCEHRRSPQLRGSTLCDPPQHHLTSPGGPPGAASGPSGSAASRPSASGWPSTPDHPEQSPTPAPPPPPPHSTTRHCRRHPQIH